MVLNDIINDYKQFIDTLDKYDTEENYIDSALSLINQYQDKVNVLADTFLKSLKRDTDKAALVNGLNTLENAFNQQIAAMNSSLRNTTRLITEIERIDFISPSVKENASILCHCLNELMDITEEYAANKIKGKFNKDTFFHLISDLENFKKVHVQIYSNYEILSNIEKELLEKLPFEDTESSPIYTLDIRSCKPELNIVSFTDDLKLLADCLQNLERLVNPNPSQSIYIRKIESGSLKAIFSSDKVDFSIFPDLITSISNAIRTWRLTPAEKAKIEAETAKTQAETELIRAQTEAQQIKNEESKIVVVNSQINYICERLQLDPKESREQIQKFCLPLINYIEHNPIGSFNGVSYDISKDVRLLEAPEK